MKLLNNICGICCNCASSVLESLQPIAKTTNEIAKIVINIFCMLAKFSLGFCLGALVCTVSMLCQFQLSGEVTEGVIMIALAAGIVGGLFLGIIMIRHDLPYTSLIPNACKLWVTQPWQRTC